MDARTVYEFGSFRLDRSARVLLTGGQVVPLTPKVLDLLLVLVENNGQVVAKDDLLKAVWPDTFVEESNLTSNMSILRKQLGVPPDGGEYIETIPKRGYRFTVKVNRAGTLPAPATRGRRRIVVTLAAGIATVLLIGWMWRTKLSGTPLHIQAIAVLPLANLSGDPAQEYFADGMTEALTTDLAQIGALRVISRASVMQFKNTKIPLLEIAHRLKVDAVVMGSVLRSGPHVRITAQLIYAAADRHLWAGTYERELDDILDLQKEVVRAIAREVRARVTPEEQTRLARNRSVNAQAYEAYLKGRHMWNQYTEPALWKSTEYFEQAIHLDPAYAAAYAGLANSWVALQYMGAPPEEIHPKAVQSALKALEIDEACVEAHTALSVIKAEDWDWAAAEKEARRAFELNPGYVETHIIFSNQLRHCGRFQESIAEAKQAIELDPLAALANEALADAYRSAREYDLAIEQYRKTLELYPNRPAPRNSLGWIYIYKGLYREGIEEIKNSYGEDPELSPELAYVYARSGEKRKAIQILERLQRLSRQTPIAAHHFALIFLGLDRPSETLNWLNRAYQEHSQMMSWLKVDPRFDHLRPDPRFQDLVRRVGIP
jgi:TolB-like protein/DNA-binding winged helix-turn-helix (wHTH) protein/Tfp pilus assembly protein PilF